MSNELTETESKSSGRLSVLFKRIKAERGMPVKLNRSFTKLDSNIEIVVALIEVVKEKMKVAAIIPLYFQDDEMMKIIFSPSQIAKLKRFCDGYTRHTSESHHAVESEIDYRLLKAIELAYSNPKAKEDMTIRWACLPEEQKRFVTSFHDVCSIIQVRLKTSASMEIRQDSALHAFYHEHMKTKSVSSLIRKQLQEKETSVQWKLGEKQALISKYNRDLSDRKWQNNIIIQTEVVSANKKMNEICMQSESYLSKLQDEANKIKKNYNDILKENVIAYKKLSEKKDRVLAQLVGWIKKYDSDVGEKIVENDKLKRDLAKCTEELNAFLVKFEQQEALYNEVAAAKDAEEKAAQEDKLMLFMMNRAAKIIQRAWRKFKSKRKRGKGKGKKGKKGKK